MGPNQDEEIERMDQLVNTKALHQQTDSEFNQVKLHYGVLRGRIEFLENDGSYRRIKRVFFISSQKTARNETHEGLHTTEARP